MTDPAVAAARRAWEGWDWSDDQSISVLVDSAAREALKPIAELLAELFIEQPGDVSIAPELWEFLARLTPLVFTTEELER
ncbi:Uncharacterised protein [Mycobacteroides abscessus subsp. abscessus]|uniref:hypothetical protein n=1 Tax=Mycobacteroides abscessus TaxID=36809 RepID=UPI00092B5441|nr:hypothetical protein [Mycobacteroides abscessus]SII79532.1 Uncharacterised protein [Mycobacteroides abscessus subsp. abscessus]SII85067.1 Uncharacterised protein [Mycobacteroides abscessus subsp. abscessus]SIL59859.1 Uncharacterised protein [Mycobacteroides abscessus subsp. abscessus]